MEQRFQCELGHDWRADGDSAEAVCPDCGAMSVTVVGPLPPPPTSLVQPPPADPSAAPSSLRPDIPGYEVLEVLGRGGMGIVYKARQLALDRLVALKTILTGPYAGSAEVSRFLGEAQIVANLRHENIVQIFEVGQHQGQPYLCLELVEGGSLDRKLAHTPQPPVDAARMTAVLARALERMHDAKIIHRDLKPHNILLTPEGTPKIADFGLAKRLAQETPGLTPSAAILGTPEYMAPEQASGRTRDSGCAADIYSLGAMLYEMLTGRPPFRGVTWMDTLSLVMEKDPAAPRQLQPRIPRDLETVCLKCLHKTPGQRYATAAALADDLERFLRGEPIVGRRPGWGERALRWARRRPARATLVGMALVLVVLGTAAAFWYQAKVSDAEGQTRAQTLVEGLAGADFAAVPRFIEELQGCRRWSEPLLQAALARAETGSAARLHYSLALLESDPAQLAYVLERAVHLPPQHVLYLQKVVGKQQPSAVPILWSILEGPGHDEKAKLRAAGLLAALSPDDARWPTLAQAILRGILREDLLDIGRWTEVFQPVSAALAPEARKVVLDPARSEGDRDLAVSCLIAFAPDHEPWLREALLATSDRQFAPVLAALTKHPASVAALRKLLQSGDTDAPEASRIDLARNQAKAAVALLHMGHAADVWPLFKHQPDPTLRAFLIQRLKPLGVNPAVLAQRLRIEMDVSSRRALLLALGEYDLGELGAAQREDVLLKGVIDLFRSHHDPGIHSAAEWVLGRWRQHPLQTNAAPTEGATFSRRPDNKRWFQAVEGHTFAILPSPTEFLMGSPDDEPDRLGSGSFGSEEYLHKKSIPRTLALATKEVTLAQFRRFLAANPDLKIPLIPRFEQDPHWPIVAMTWYEAAQYCRWLSEQDNVAPEQMCYPPLAEIKEGMRLPADFLSRTGYRLPTEAEWEFACRAGAVTSRGFGRAPELLPYYACFVANSGDFPARVGTFRPNDFGLFDMHGNVWEWCHDAAQPYQVPPPGQASVDDEKAQAAKEGLSKMLRGGAFNYQHSMLRCARRYRWQAGNRDFPVGFRIARTMAS